MKQIIANFLRKLIKLDDYIEDRVFTDIERLEAEIEVVNDLAEEHETELNDRPTFYDMETHVEHVFGDSTIDVIEDITKRLKKLEDK
tara:strand:- start:168 stop:428 length:261 start_codon:yes stop_codon:yes gene_type:complete